MRKIITACTLAAVSLGAALGFTVADAGDTLPDYAPTTGVSGSIKSVGSDTMINLMTLWGEEFKKFYPNTSIEVEGKGSSTAPPALIEGQAQFGPMSREMKSSEIDQFEARYGYKPTALRAGIDTLAVYVHKDNPIEGLSLAQLRQVFSVDGPANLTWGDLGLTGEWADKPISLYGRNSASGTYGFFKDVALGKKDFKPTVKEQPGSSAVVQGVATDKYGIGYSGIGYKTADVRIVPIARSGTRFVEPGAATALDGSYPLGRFLYVYINHKPGTNLARQDPLRGEFVRLMFSRQGQEVVAKDGYDPVTADIARQELRKVGIEPDF